MSPVEPVSARIEGRIGRITLQRPEALNALTTAMVTTIDETLEEWAGLGLRAVIVDSAARHFCAGGDVRRVREHALAGEWTAVEEFFRREYRMNLRIAEYRTPIVSLIDGVCMGGGMGIAIHGHFRVVTERAVLAMPETAIGFIPDVGASHFLARLPGTSGQYLGLTGTRIGAADALALGLATHVVPSGRLAEIAALVAGSDAPIASLVDEITMRPSAAALLTTELDSITAAFAAGTADAVLERVDSAAQEGSPWAQDAAAALRRASAASLDAAHELIARGRERTLAECLDAELAAGMRLVQEGDFVEGVRARLVDKDDAPAWLRG